MVKIWPHNHPLLAEFHSVFLRSPFQIGVDFITRKNGRYNLHAIELRRTEKSPHSCFACQECIKDVPRPKGVRACNFHTDL